ncbi:MAG: hypothetical protein Kow0099_20640 [Candidatus Abyssubacteria bacterium]
MNTKRSFAMLVVVSMSILGLVTTIWAETHEVSLKADKSHERAGGTLLLSDDSVSVEAEGLRPNGVYTVWFVNMKPKKHEAGAGEAPYMFKTDGEGYGSYTSSLKESPFGKWQMVMIVLHVNGDPRNMKDMVPALSAPVPKSHH